MSASLLFARTTWLARAVLVIVTTYVVGMMAVLGVAMLLGAAIEPGILALLRGGHGDLAAAGMLGAPPGILIAIGISCWATVAVAAVIWRRWLGPWPVAASAEGEPGVPAAAWWRQWLATGILIVACGAPLSAGKMAVDSGSDWLLDRPVLEHGLATGAVAMLVIVPLALPLLAAARWSVRRLLRG